MNAVCYYIFGQTLLHHWAGARDYVIRMISLCVRKCITLSGVCIILSCNHYIIGYFCITLSGTYYINMQLLQY